jgi:hypothetical protein
MKKNILLGIPTGLIAGLIVGQLTSPKQTHQEKPIEKAKEKDEHIKVVHQTSIENSPQDPDEKNIKLFDFSKASFSKGQLQWDIANMTPSGENRKSIIALWEFVSPEETVASHVYVDAVPQEGVFSIRTEKGRFTLSGNDRHTLNEHAEKMLIDSIKTLRGLLSDLPLDKEEDGAEYIILGNRMSLEVIHDGKTGARLLNIENDGTYMQMVDLRTDGNFSYLNTVNKNNIYIGKQLTVRQQ